MKKLLKITKTGLILIVTLLSINQTCTAATTDVVAKTFKVGVVNTKNLLENCLYAKDLQQKLEKEFGPRKSKFDSMQKDLQTKNELLQRDRAILADKERTSKEREITKLQQEVQHTLETLESELNSRRQEALTELNGHIEKVLFNLAYQEKYDLILPDQVVMFSANALDCTAKIIAELDAKFKAKK